MDDAKDFLEAVLANGPVLSTSLLSEAQGEGHTKATIRRAKVELGIKSARTAMAGPWFWQLPAKVLKNAEGAQPNNVSPFEENEHLRENEDCLAQQIAELLCRHPKGFSDEDISEILQVPLSEVKTVRGCHG